MIKGADLKGQKLLCDLDDRELESIAKRMTREQHAKGAQVFRDGEPTKGIFLIKKGKVEISKPTPDGWKQTLALLTELHFFGELSVIEDRKNHSTNTTAVDDAELYRITVDEFKALEKDEPVMMYKIMKTMARMASRNVHMMNEKLIKALISY
ncbi:MAG: cyclic nucleotide-binding domain-containing protein [Nitrospirota bacterium]|nr:cyclic nucleotide-binding domain-containing protein [Nitrospirota bacterium]